MTAHAFKTEVKRWASRIGVQPKRVQVQRMTRKWASCSSGGCICFSRALLQKDKTFQDLVIVHELLHLRVANHGKLFKSLLNAYVPVLQGRGLRGVGSCHYSPARAKLLATGGQRNDS